MLVGLAPIFLLAGLILGESLSGDPRRTVSANAVTMIAEPPAADADEATGGTPGGARAEAAFPPGEAPARISFDGTSRGAQRAPAHFPALRPESPVATAMRRLDERRRAASGTRAPGLRVPAPDPGAAGPAHPQPTVATAGTPATVGQARPRAPAQAAPEAASPATSRAGPLVKAPEPGAGTRALDPGSVRHGGWRRAPPRSGIADGPARVVLHYRPGGAAAQDARLLREALAGGGLRGTELRRVGVPVQRADVRYFHPGDEALADSLNRMLQARGYRSALRNFTAHDPPPSPGTVEVWLPG